jgi:hypothetical protein
VGVDSALERTSDDDLIDVEGDDMKPALEEFELKFGGKHILGYSGEMRPQQSSSIKSFN